MFIPDKHLPKAFHPRTKRFSLISDLVCAVAVHLPAVPKISDVPLKILFVRGNDDPVSGLLLAAFG